MFAVGDKVRIKPEWCDHPEGAEKEYTVVNVNDITKRCYIEAEVPGFSFPLQSLVAFYMIEHVESDVKVYRKLTLEERKKTFDNYQALCAEHSELTPFEDFDQYDREQEKLDLVFDAETLECLG